MKDILWVARSVKNGNKITPSFKDYTGVICQIVSEFNEDGEIKRYLGTGSIQIADN